MTHVGQTSYLNLVDNEIAACQLNPPLSGKNQWGCFSCAFDQSNKPLHGPTPHSHTVLPYSRERWNGILTEIDVINADQGNIVWNTQTVFCESTKNTNSHEIAPGNDSS